MNIQKSSINEKLLYISVFLIPFSNPLLLRLPFIGELGIETNFFTLCLFILVGPMSFFRGLSALRSTVGWLYIFFFLAVLLSITFNFGDMAVRRFKGQDGYERLIGQFLVIAFYAVVSINVCGILTKVDFNLFLSRIRLSIIYSFLVSSAFVFLLEIPAWLLGGPFASTFFAFSEFYFGGYSNDFRIRGFSFEPPYYAIFLSTALVAILTSNDPWIRKTRIILLAATFFQVLLTGSRFGLGASIVILTLYFVTGVSRSFGFKVIPSIVLIALLMPIAVLFDYVVFDAQTIQNSYLKLMSLLDYGYNQTGHEISNTSRYGAMAASFGIFQSYPFFGVGLGQQGFFYPEYYPDWAMNSWEVLRWIDGSYYQWPPGFSLYTRLLAETGGLAFVLFIAFVICVIYRYFSFDRKYIQARNSETKFAFMLCVMMVFCFLTTDSFRFIIIWILFGGALNLTLARRNGSLSVRSLKNP